MIKPKILSDEEVKKIDIPLNLCHYWFSTRRYAERIAQAQNDYCYKETLRQVIVYLGNDRGWGLVKKVKALQGLVEGQIK